MKMKYISKYFFNIFLILCGFTTFAQVNDSVTVASKTERYGLRVGADLSKIARTLYDSNYQGLELVGDFRLNKKYFLAAELGSENKTTDDDQINFKTTGTYIKVGFDYNAHENWLDLENIISVGLRYGVSTFSQKINSYEVYNPNPYFGVIPDTQSGTEFGGLSAQWIEVVAGVKTRVFDNFFVGFTLRANRLMSNQKPSGFDNLYIPGFNRTYDGDFGVGFNYTLTYFIPIYKKKILSGKKF
jgi:hypothetical protein